VDGPRIRAIKQMDKLRKMYPGKPAGEKSAGESDALDLWRQKLDFLQQQEAVVADPVQKFALAEQIKEAKAKIAELEATPMRQLEDAPTGRDQELDTLERNVRPAFFRLSLLLMLVGVVIATIVITGDHTAIQSVKVQRADILPVPSLPQVKIETLPGLPEGMTNDPRLRLNRLIVRNVNEVSIFGFCSRL
jgi:hypothetical protein